jgi:hypothetical protein
MGWIFLEKLIHLFKKFLGFVKPVGLLPSSSYPMRGESSSRAKNHFSSIHFNIIFPSMIRFLEHTLRFSDQNFVYISHLHSAYYIYHLPQPSQCNYWYQAYTKALSITAEPILFLCLVYIFATERYIFCTSVSGCGC